MSDEQREFMSTMTDALWQCIQQRINGTTRTEFLQQLRDQVQQYSSGSEFIYKQISRDLLGVRAHLGTQYLVASFSQRDQSTLMGHYGAVPIGHWKVDEACRVWYLSSLLDGRTNGYQILFELYDQGDSECRIACLRALNFCQGEVEHGLALIHDAGRTYLPDLLSAAWRHNPFSSQFLSDLEYRKAVLKALFCEIPVEGFLKLYERADADLSRSLCEYANEREAAGRPVPLSIWTVAARFPIPGLVARLIGRLEHPNQQERLYAARALQSAVDSRSESFLQERLQREKNVEVQQAIQGALHTLQAGDHG